MGQSSTIELGLQAGTDPSRDTGHTLTVRAQYSGDASLLTVRLYDGATLIDSFSFTMATSWTDHVLTIDPEDAALITDYTDLRVWMLITTVNHPSGTSTGQVSWVQLEYPAADGTQGLTVGLTQNLAATFGPSASGGSVQYLEPATAWNVGTTYSEEYGESYGGGGPTVFDPSFDRVIDVDVALKQQLVTVFGPNVKRASDIDPALAQQLATTFAPGFTIDIPISLAAQLLSVFEDLALSQVGAAQPVSVTRKQNLAVAFAPGFTVDVPIGIAQQLVAGFDPSFTVDVTPAVAQQLVVAVDPTVAVGPLGIYPALVDQSAAGHDPTLLPGTVDLAPALAQQLATVFSPEAEVTFGTMVLVQQLVTTFNPTVTQGENIQVHFYLNTEEGLEFEPDPVASFGSESVPAGSTGVGVARG